MIPRLHQRLIAGFMVLAVLGGGCAPTETGNPPSGSVSLALRAISSAPATAALENRGGLLVERVELEVAVLRLLPCDPTQPKLEAAAGGYVLLDDAQLPAALELKGSLRLCGAELELATTTDDTNAAHPAIFVQGKRTDGSPFEVSSQSPVTIELHTAPGVTFGDKPLLLGFDVGVWFEQVDVHGAASDGAGVARIDNAMNQGLLSSLEAHTTTSFALYEDSNGDGVLQPGEATPLAK